MKVTLNPSILNLFNSAKATTLNPLKATTCSMQENFQNRIKVEKEQRLQMEGEEAEENNQREIGSK